MKCVSGIIADRRSSGGSNNIQNHVWYKKERAIKKIARFYVGIGPRADDSGPMAGWWRSAPTPIAVHRRAAQKGA
jgi:hypothetical protein